MSKEPELQIITEVNATIALAITLTLVITMMSMFVDICLLAIMLLENHSDRVFDNLTQLLFFFSVSALLTIPVLLLSMRAVRYGSFGADSPFMKIVNIALVTQVAAFIFSVIAIWPVYRFS